MWRPCFSLRVFLSSSLNFQSVNNHSAFLFSSSGFLLETRLSLEDLKIHTDQLFGTSRHFMMNSFTHPQHARRLPHSSPTHVFRKECLSQAPFPSG
ncbi:hypothetical protein CEP54_013345 [Fusarium duplospermum]|uniref:Uncharacterized protein n=1 Tax=Fusarium duplospermum TaxID=1325734 RepID=A0A428P3H6_9HYPO|nr:hypothetical protein CEP54_013345 [Fusarium duplospermum]